MLPEAVLVLFYRWRNRVREWPVSARIQLPLKWRRPTEVQGRCSQAHHPTGTWGASLHLGSLFPKFVEGTWTIWLLSSFRAWKVSENKSIKKITIDQNSINMDHKIFVIGSHQEVTNYEQLSAWKVTAFTILNSAIHILLHLFMLPWPFSGKY